MSKFILAADDNPIISTLVELTLIKAGFQVETVSDGLSVLARLTTLKPDLIILDLDMPLVSGLETLRRIKENADVSGTPVLMLTSSGEVHNIVHARRTGAAGYLVKPFEPQDLVNKVHLLLEDSDVLWVDDYTSVTRVREA